MLLITQHVLINDQINHINNPTGLHPSQFHVVLHLPSCCRQAQKDYLWACLQVLFVVLAIQDSCVTAVVL